MDGGGKRRNKSKTKNKSKSKTKTKNKSKANSSRPDLTPEEIEALRELKARVNSDLDEDAWNALGYAELSLMEDMNTDVDNLLRVDYDEMSTSTFTKKILEKNIPCIIENGMNDWKATRKWTRKKFAKRFGEEQWDVGSYNHTYMTLNEYLRYCDTNNDDSPLYIFQPNYHAKYPKLLKEFTIPKYFDEASGNDVMGVLDDEPRPYYRWVLMGPERSGTGIHQDPNNTTAWNALLQGHKRWCMFPPHIKSRVVKPKKGEPDSGIYWFREIYPRLLPDAEKLGMIECVQGPGEIVVVPDSWWHVVLNLDFTISVTQNHVSDCTFERVFKSLKKSKPKRALAWYNVLGPDFQARVTPPAPEDISESSSSYSYDSSPAPADDKDSASDSGSSSASSS